MDKSQINTGNGFPRIHNTRSFPRPQGQNRSQASKRLELRRPAGHKCFQEPLALQRTSTFKPMAASNSYPTRPPRAILSQCAMWHLLVDCGPADRVANEVRLGRMQRYGFTIYTHVYIAIYIYICILALLAFRTFLDHLLCPFSSMAQLSSCHGFLHQAT